LVFTNEGSSGVEEGEFEIKRTKRIELKPMGLEEAILQMELLGHHFYICSDADEDAIQVVYKRKDGSFGLLQSH
jgi:putative sigma-54 modulation protein